MRKLLLRWVIDAVAVYAAAALLQGISVEGDAVGYLWVALVLGLANALIAPIIKLLTCPLIILTLGLFTLVINAIMLWLTSLLVPGFHVDTFGAAFLGALIISVVSFALSVLTGVNREDRRKKDD
ncbi:MAG: phage holin family protein [Chloroflexi bacterium]|jgi:putative membrane protein|nr:phage holin family protein [Chloroflexota bacterium]